MCLMKVLADTLLEWLKRCGCYAFELSLARHDIGKISLGNLAYATIRDVADGCENHLIDGMCTVHKLFNTLSCVVFECGFAT